MGESERPGLSENALAVPPLTSADKDGKRYTRRPDVEATVRQLLGLPVDEWPTAARKKGEERIPSEALVFLIRAIKASDRNAVGALVDVLCRRIAGIARRLARGFDPAVTHEILLEVQDQVIELLFAEVPTRQSEFLEIAFTKAVERRTINVVAKYTNAPEMVVVNEGKCDDEDGPKYVAELLSEEQPGPEQILLLLEDEAKRRVLIKKALAAVKDPRHVHAVILRHVRGWPISTQDEAKPSLEKHFGKSARQIQNWITSALEAMRKAIEESR